MARMARLGMVCLALVFCTLSHYIFDRLKMILTDITDESSRLKNIIFFSGYDVLITSIV